LQASLGVPHPAQLTGQPERRLQEAAKHGLGEVIGPPGSGDQALEVKSLREAIAVALPARERPQTAPIQAAAMA
jgi:hypothetical protein